MIRINQYYHHIKQDSKWKHFLGKVSKPKKPIMKGNASITLEDLLIIIGDLTIRKSRKFERPILIREVLKILLFVKKGKEELELTKIHITEELINIIKSKDEINKRYNEFTSGTEFSSERSKLLNFFIEEGKEWIKGKPLNEEMDTIDDEINVKIILNTFNNWFKREIDERIFVVIDDENRVQLKIFEISGPATKEESPILFFSFESDYNDYQNEMMHLEAENQRSILLGNFIENYNEIIQKKSLGGTNQLKTEESLPDLFISKAQQMCVEGNIGKAIEECNKGIHFIQQYFNTSPGKVNSYLEKIYIEYVNILLKSKRIAEAKDILETARPSISYNEYCILKGQIYVANGNTSEAIHYYRGMRDELHPSLHFGVGLIADYYNAFADDPEDPGFAFIYDDLDERDPVNRVSYLMKVNIKLAEIFAFFIYGEREEAETCVNEAILLAISLNKSRFIGYGYYLKGIIEITKDYRGKGEINPGEAMLCFQIASTFQQYLSEDEFEDIHINIWVAHILEWMQMSNSRHFDIENLYSEFQIVFSRFEKKPIIIPQVWKAIKFFKEKYINGRLERNGEIWSHYTHLKQDDKEFLNVYWNSFKKIRDEINMK